MKEKTWMYVVFFLQISALTILRTMVNGTWLVKEGLPFVHQAHLVQGGWWMTDQFIVGGREVVFSFVSVVIAALSVVLGTGVAVLVLNLIASTVIIYLVDNLLIHLGYSNQQRWFILSMVVVSPTVIYASLSSAIVLVAVQAAGLVALLKKKFVLGIILLMISGSSGVLPLTISVLLVGWLYSKEALSPQIARRAVISQAIVLVGVLLYQWVAVPFSAFVLPQSRGLGSVILEVGSVGGLSIVMLALALLGGLVAYKQRYFANTLIFLGLLVVSFWLPVARLYSGLACAFLSGLFVAYLFTYQWELRQLRMLSFAAIGVGVFFSLFLVFAQSMVVGPQREQMDAMNWIAQNTSDESVFFAPVSEGYVIEAIARRKVWVDEDWHQLSQGIKRADMVNNLTNEVYLERVTKVFDEQNITHVYFPSELVLAKDASSPSGGMMYLLKNNETFKNVYGKDGHMVWEYKHPR